jgi:hypothetical protein
MKIILILVLVIIFLIILLSLNNKKENFNITHITRYYPLRSFNTSIINNSTPAEFSNYFGLKNSDNTDVKYYLLYNKYIDLMNTLIDSNLLSKLQTLNINCSSLNKNLLTYLYCKSIYPSNKNENKNTNYIEYTNTCLNLIMIKNNNIFRLDDKLKKAVLIYNLPYNLNGTFIDTEQYVKENSNKISIGLNSSEYTSIVTYMNGFHYGTNIISKKEFLLSMAAIIYNYYIKYLNHAKISLTNINTKNTNNSSYITKLKTYKPSIKPAYNRFMKHYNKTIRGSIQLPKNLDTKNLKDYLQKKINPVNLNLSSGEGTTPPYVVDLETLEIKHSDSETVFNNLLSQLSILSKKLTSLESTHTSYLKMFNKLNSENLSKYICASPNDATSYPKYKGGYL